jgi:hypothetical protein
MHKFEILLYLFYFKFIAAVPDRTIVPFLFLVSARTNRVVEEVIPIKVFIVFFRILLKINGFILGYSQFHANDFRKVSGRYFFSSEKIPNK